MTDSVSYCVVTYLIKCSKKYRVRTYSDYCALHALAHDPKISIISVKVVPAALPGEGLSWVEAIKNLFKRGKS